MQQTSGIITHPFNLRQQVEHYTVVDPKSSWVKRSRRMDHAIRHAWKNDLPVRLVALDGVRRDRNDPNSSASRVSARRLGPVEWGVTSYNDATGEGELTRGAETSKFVDQFSDDIESLVKKSPKQSNAYSRDPNIRKKALSRANGKCEQYAPAAPDRRTAGR